MNKLRIRTIALGLLTGALAEAGLGYNQSTYGTVRATPAWKRDMTGRHCGTTACIAGAAVAIYQPELWDGFVVKGQSAVTMFNTGKALLDLDYPTAAALFDGVPLMLTQGQGDSPSARHAAAVLFHLAETGKVDWNWTKLPAEVADWP